MDEFSKYARQIALVGFGEQGQSKLHGANIIVVGAGGVGSAALPLLAASGIGKILIVDCDVVSVSNLHRQTLYEDSQVGGSKSRLAAQKLSRLNPECKIEFIDAVFTDSPDFETAVKNCDLCLDATDSFSSRLCVSKLCARFGKPEILASAGGYVSQTMVFGDGFYFDKYVGCDSSAASEKSAGLPIFPPAAHLSGVLAAGKAIEHLSDVRPLHSGDFSMFDFRTSLFRKFNTLNA